MSCHHDSYQWILFLLLVPIAAVAIMFDNRNPFLVSAFGFT